MGHLTPGQQAVAGDVVDPRHLRAHDELDRAHDVVLLDELQPRVETEDARREAAGQLESLADRRDDVGAEDIGEPKERHRDVGVVLGEVAQVILHLEQ